MTQVTFWLDPACFWTWRAARWLRDVRPQRNLTIEWSSFSLLELYGDDMNPDWRDMLAASHGALRVLEALKTKGNPDDPEAFYVALGSAVHEQGEAMTAAAVLEAARRAGVADHAEAMDDRAWDEPIRLAFRAAMDSAGPDIGSPVLHVAGHPRGLQGPVFTTIPDAADAVGLWDAVHVLSASPLFLEVKRGRP